MTDAKRIEVNLEICSGFFRIPTDSLVYNITVLPAGESSATKVVEKIIEVEKVVEVASRCPASSTAPVVIPASAPDNGYFARCLRHLAAELTDAGQDDPPGSTPVGAAVLRDLATLAGELTRALQAMRDAAVLSHTNAGPSVSALSLALDALAERLSQAQGQLAGPGAQAATKTVTRYRFNLDAVFQTIYELCTNETVKGHIQSARAQAGEIFDLERFYDAISPKAAGYKEDDGFLAVPMTDIYTALSSVCSDKGICNLLAKMDKQKATIFLDQFLPLEVPPKEEVAVPDPEAQAEGASADGVAGLLTDCRAEIDSLRHALEPDEGASLAGQVEAVMNVGLRLKGELERLATSLAGAGPDVGGLRRRVAGLAALARTLLDLQEKQPGLVFEDALAAAALAAAMNAGGELASAAAPPCPEGPEKPLVGAALSPDDFGEASQDDIDRLLEELS